MTLIKMHANNIITLMIVPLNRFLTLSKPVIFNSAYRFSLEMQNRSSEMGQKSIFQIFYYINRAGKFVIFPHKICLTFGKIRLYTQPEISSRARGRIPESTCLYISHFSTSGNIWKYVHLNFVPLIKNYRENLKTDIVKSKVTGLWIWDTHFLLLIAFLSATAMILTRNLVILACFGNCSKPDPCPPKMWVFLLTNLMYFLYSIMWQQKISSCVKRQKGQWSSKGL